MALVNQQAPVIKPGDMVRFNRGLYYHWGVCIADNQMVHVAPENGTKEINSLNSLSGANNKAVVRIELIDKWAFDGDYRADNYLDHRVKPKTVDDICSFALQQVDNFYWVYDPVSSNCEKFAIWCRYRVDEWGRQGELVRNVAVTSLAVVGAAAVGVIGAACLGFKAVDTALNCGKKKRGESRQQQQITAEDSANDEHNQEDDVVELDDI
ncbi:phospholipase A and acyltransferase 3-like [Convolutriloba macropyga]|uniref:phospholipase A and acyltransferase 3-like n=1 Tax=Convolutriloba macropyga TaxID=536237 RepID=UPI003F51EF9C